MKRDFQKCNKNVALLFTGYDLIEWLMERLTIEDSRKFEFHFIVPLSKCFGLENVKC